MTSINQRIKVRKIVRESFSILKKRFWKFAPLVGAVLITAAVNPYVLEPLNNYSKAVYLTYRLFYYILQSYLNALLINLTLKIVVEKKYNLPIKNIFVVREIFFKKFIVDFVTSFLIITGLFFFVIPGVYLSVRLQFSSYIILHKNTSVLESLKESWSITRGMVLKLFILMTILLILNAFGIIFFYLGLFVSYPLFLIAQAKAYDLIKNNKRNINN